MGDVKLTGADRAGDGLARAALRRRRGGCGDPLGGVGGILALLAGSGRKSAIPFGPFLTAGAFVAVFWGERIADWYLRSMN